MVVNETNALAWAGQLLQAITDWVYGGGVTSYPVRDFSNPLWFLHSNGEFVYDRKYYPSILFVLGRLGCVDLVHQHFLCNCGEVQALQYKGDLPGARRALAKLLFALHMTIPREFLRLPKWPQEGLVVRLQRWLRLALFRLRTRRRLALAMALHSRLGAGSALGALDADILAAF